MTAYCAPQNPGSVVHDRGCCQVIHRNPFFQQRVSAALSSRSRSLRRKITLRSFSSQLIVAFVSSGSHHRRLVYISERSCARARDNQWRPCFIASEYCRPHSTMAKFAVLKKILPSARISCYDGDNQSQARCRGIGHIAFIRGAFVLLLSSEDRARGPPSEAKTLAHPVGVPLSRGNSVTDYPSHMHAPCVHALQ